MSIDLETMMYELRHRITNIDNKALEKIAYDLIYNLDERLEPNLREWINGEKISDIWIGKYCVNAIMSIRRDNDFLSALEAMNTYLHNEEDGIRLIWRGRR